ncbi:MAG: hypothetical protein WCJ55_19755 [Chloroflexales bacterium]
MVKRAHPTNAELTRARAEAEASMLDACLVLRRSTTGQDAATGMPIEAWVPVGDVVPCDVTIRSRRETHGTAQILVTTVSGRLPLRVDLTSLDRICVTQKLGFPLAVSETYEIVELKPGGLEWLVELKRPETLEG